MKLHLETFREILAVILRPNHYRLKVKRLESELKETTQNLELVNNDAVILNRRIEIAEDQAIELGRQVTGLKDWIRHVHRLDKAPLANTIRDILQKTANRQ